MLPFSDRAEAGHFLAAEVHRYVGQTDCIVLALPCGGVPVAFKVAKHLRSPLDLLFVAKIGVPWEPELALGAVASDGVIVCDSELTRSLHLSDQLVRDLASRKEKILKARSSAFRSHRPALVLTNQTVILVDDGIATGSTMLAAVRSVRNQDPKQIIVAVPVASLDAAEQFRLVADKFICLGCPEPFMAVGHWYKSFPQVSYEVVKDLVTECSDEAGQKASGVAAANG